MKRFRLPYLRTGIVSVLGVAKHMLCTLIVLAYAFNTKTRNRHFRGPGIECSIRVASHVVSMLRDFLPISLHWPSHCLFSVSVLFLDICYILIVKRGLE